MAVTHENRLNIAFRLLPCYIYIWWSGIRFFFYNSCFDFTIIEWCSLSTLIVDITKTYQYFMWTNKTVMTVNSFFLFPKNGYTKENIHSIYFISLIKIWLYMYWFKRLYSIMNKYSQNTKFTMVFQISAYFMYFQQNWRFAIGWIKINS